ncbi:putative integral membrane protein [Theileria parva strain Muguga]|uniref:putative integral membrane protein n=1 Tax=Theileria parva strain Muguga TaxID=333668 RepID=UPI001C61D7E3|nr:putative integral membrane protein [Theileria parva strain Muguga]KAF5153428.1 putative integral membrane protein [Theileria parva strain Muguga]
MRVLNVYNVVGFLICLFYGLKTTPYHIFYIYSKVLLVLNLYRYIPFFWDVIFYTSLFLSFHSLLDSIQQFNGITTAFRVIFTNQLKNKRNRMLMEQILSSLFCLVCWSFIKFYRSERDKSHELILRRQETTEYQLLHNTCLKI